MNIDHKSKTIVLLVRDPVRVSILLLALLSLCASEGNTWTKIIAENSHEQDSRYLGGNTNGVQTDQLAQQVLANIVAAYSSVSTYRDKGAAIVHLTDVDVSYRLEFETLFKRPNKLRFEWTQTYSRVPGHKQKGVIWYDGVTAWSRYSVRGNKVMRKRDLEVLVAGATGASWGTAHRVSALLCDDVRGTRLDDLRSVRIVGSDSVDGIECTVLHGEIPSGGERKIWVSKRDNLIHRIEERYGNVKLEEVLREIFVNEDIEDSRFSEIGN